MRAGVKVKDLVSGSGEEASRGKTVVADVHLYLNYGCELTAKLGSGVRMVIDLDHGTCIPGLRYGIEGMRVGGLRELTINPNLAYGADGIRGLVPPNSIIRGQVSLLEVRENPGLKPDDYPPGRQLCVTHPGEAIRNQPRWQYHLEDDGRFEIAIAHPAPGLQWHLTQDVRETGRLEEETTRRLFENAFSLPQSFPGDCHRKEDLWADTIERGNSILRVKTTNALCLFVGVMERGECICDIHLSSDSQAMYNLPLMRVIHHLVSTSEQHGMAAQMFRHSPAVWKQAAPLQV